MFSSTIICVFLASPPLAVIVGNSMLTLELSSLEVRSMTRSLDSLMSMYAI